MTEDMEIERITKGSFKKEYIDGDICFFGYYFTNVNGRKLEITLESCIGGFCVGIFQKLGIMYADMLEPKICTGDIGYIVVALYTDVRLEEIWECAIGIANKLAEKYKYY